MPERKNAELFQSLIDRNHDFDWFTCEASASVKTPEMSVSGKAYIRMKYDSIIWSSVKKIAEGARALITEDQYAVVNRLERTYMQGSTNQAMNRFGVSLGFLDVQHAIFGNVIIPDTTSMMIDIAEGKYYRINARDAGLNLTYFINGYNMHLEKVNIVDNYGRGINIEYGDYKKAKNSKIILPYYRRYFFDDAENGDISLTLNMKEIEINEPKKTKFSIPNRYDRIY